MKIIADDNIPFIREYFGSQGELVLMPGRGLTRADIGSAEMLILRSVTRVDRELLEGSQVKFVGSVATGVDHIDAPWLKQMGIPWAAAQGFNAIGVVEYVVSVLAALSQREILNKPNKRAAVVGVGRVGSQVAAVLRLLGFQVVLCDPLRAEAEPNFVSVPLQELKDLDLISLHTPLTREGAYPTYHMIDKAFIQRQTKNCVMLSAGRGAVVDFDYLKEYGEQLYWCLDVWENEPSIDFEVLALAEIATPHIAGYTVQSKYRSIAMIHRAACELMGLPASQLPALEVPRLTLSFDNQKVDWRDVVLKVYDPQPTTIQMKNALVENGSDKTFDALRNHFQDRHEFAYVTVKEAVLEEESRVILQALGFQLA